MLKELDTVKLIFGLKVQQLRREQQLSYQQLSDKTGLAISYLHNIEKGKKYPKADKILALAKALKTDYNYLVSLDAGKKLQPIIDLLKSDFLQIFPLELFGINTPKLMELLSHTPDKVNAFVNTIIKIVRNYHLKGEDFYQAALRSYQDLQDNYFADIEEIVKQFRRKSGLKQDDTLDTKQLETLLATTFGINVNRTRLNQEVVLQRIRSYYAPKKKVLYLNTGLDTVQENFLLAKELGFQVLELSPRPFETRMLEGKSFDKLLNNFKASYFAVALLFSEAAVIKEVKAMANWKQWDETKFLALLDKYHLSSEMLLQRLANILPQHFGINDIFFLRFSTGPEIARFKMTKEMHLSQLHEPHANQLDEHYCRRWISINLIRRLKARQGIENIEGPIADVQISNYWNTPNAYLCICTAKVSSDDPKDSTSVTIGLLVNESLRRLFKWIDHPAIKTKDVHTACERCPISDCDTRAAPPVVLWNNRSQDAILAALKGIDQQTRG